MAKSARASSRKTNNQKLKKNVFGPVESARTARLSAKLMELAAQPLPAPASEDKKADGEAMEDAAEEPTPSDQLQGEALAMDVDMEAKPAKTVAAGKKRIAKRRAKKSSIAFPRYKDHASGKRRR
ncbi:putative protein family UPF0642 [Niveomyces insectorum RCEF 264]|uniref:DUF2423 domain-containing protein n=1 Tax=Niveomyces insectorum RCEF 264 TaxID=1081102 RepID=A0A167QRH6_9HYPO|nr:putative protein family UPF0642 [Niveomyces insectorum RCEF 264]